MVGIKANVDADGRITRLGITCALCHSSVDDSVGPGWRGLTEGERADLIEYLKTL